MTNIQAIKVGNVLNIGINGKLHKKNCSTSTEADELYKLVLKAKKNPTDENIKSIRLFLNEKLRKIILTGIEADIETGEAYLAGFNTPIPEALLDVIKDYHDNGYPMEAIINFWKLLMINPDTRVRTSLFNFIQTHDFVLTDKGYMIVYKAVYYKDTKDNVNIDKSFEEFVSNKYLHVKKEWKSSPNKYVVYQNLSNDTYEITKIETAVKWDEEDKNIQVLGKLGDLYSALIISDNNIDDVKNNNTIYCDMYTRQMDIVLGTPVCIDRKECDSDPAIDCSYGLHVGATKYVEKFANSSTAILACLVNPANVVAVPQYDHSKMRVSEYFPFAIATFENGKIDIVEQKYFEDEYQNYEADELELLIEKVKADELPIDTAIGAENDTRPMSELLKMIEGRLYDITNE